jgi:ectoine hydroxylase-related dioxygenase (phytanoyl-CoA dioxygenase family)
MFYNPAVMHGAGTNHASDRFRLAELLQVSLALGRAMQSVDRVHMADRQSMHLPDPPAAKTSDLQRVSLASGCQERAGSPQRWDRGFLPEWKSDQTAPGRGSRRYAMRRQRPCATRCRC